MLQARVIHSSPYLYGKRLIINIIKLCLFLCGLACNKSIFLLKNKTKMEVFYIKQELPINGQIRAKEVQLIGENGEKLGVVNFYDALDMAEEKKLDLVLVAPNAKPVVCKIMNYGKYKFEQAKKEKEAKKKQKVMEIKEIRITPNIEEHDFGFKAKNARKFLESGNKLKITVRFRGREINNSKAGENVLNRFIEELSDISIVEKSPKLEGKNMFVMLAKKV